MVSAWLPHYPDTPMAYHRPFSIKSGNLGLASVSYQTETADAEILIGELAGQILAAPENPEYQAVLSDKVEFLDINRDNNVLTLNFNQEYMNTKASREILCLYTG